MLDQVTSRLEQNAGSLNLIEGAIEFSAVSGNPPRHKQPAAYVVPISEQASASARVNRTVQRVVVTVGIVLAVGSARDAQGQAAASALEAVRKDVRRALLGWQIDEQHEEFEFVRGDTLAFRDGVVWVMDRFRTAIQIQS